MPRREGGSISDSDLIEGPASPAARERLVAPALALGLLVTAALLPSSRATGTSGAFASLLPSGSAHFGIAATPRGGESRQQAIQRLEARIGRGFAIDHRYYRWDHAIPTAYEMWTAGQGRIPFLNWKPKRTNGAIIPWASITAGEEDAWIAQRAAAFKAFGHPTYLTFHHEPENDVGSFGAEADYVGAFRRTVEVFRAEGVTNVAFVWTMMAWSFDARSGRSPMDFYPGDAYVDLLGADGYNWYPGKRGSRWRSFREVFRDFRGFAVSRDKPWVVVEVGAQEDPADPGRKNEWFRELLSTAEGWPELKAVIYFHSGKEYPWWVNTSVWSLGGYKEIAASAWFNLPAGPGSPPVESTERVVCRGHALEKGRDTTLRASNPDDPRRDGEIIAGTANADVLVGTPGDDIICGFGGDDMIHGRGGNDRILGGSGDDVLYGGPGGDALNGGAGDDLLRGGNGADILIAGRGSDVLQGGAGRDVLRGGRGRDLLNGGPGRDLCIRGSRHDRFRRCERVR